MGELVVNQTASTWTNNTTNVDKMLVDVLGPRQKDFVSAVLLTIVYSVIFITGMVGNICTCVVIVKNTAMQTTTNYYLFSLAMSDLLLIFFGLPTELYSIWEAYPWRLGEAFCYLRQSMLEATSYASVLTITAFTVERYLAICHPLLAHKISALSRSVKIIISIWIISLLVALPYAIHTRIYHAVIIQETNAAVPNSLICSIPFSDLSGFMYYMFQVSTFLFFVGPVTIIIILYILIGVALRRSPLSRGASDEHNYASMKSTSTAPQQPRRVVIRMLVAVTVAFIVCWAPFHAQRLMVLYVPHWTPHLLLVQSHIFYISGVLYFVSSTMNPILYNVISKRYREAFKQTICPCCYSRPPAGKTSATRQVDRSSKTQAVVVLKNGSDGVRVVFSQDRNHPVIRDYETIPLNGTTRTTFVDENEISGFRSDLDNSFHSNSSVDLPASSPINKSGGPGRDTQQCETGQATLLLKQAPSMDSEIFVNPNTAGGKDYDSNSREKKAAAALIKAEQPRKAYAHKVNRCASLTTQSPSCDLVSSNSAIVR